MKTKTILISAVLLLVALLGIGFSQEDITELRAKRAAFAAHVKANPIKDSDSFTIIVRDEAFLNRNSTSKDALYVGAEWVNVGTQEITRGPHRFAKRTYTLAVDTGRPTQEEREGFDGDRVFKISDLVKARSERYAFNDPEVVHRMREDRDPKSHCVNDAALGTPVFPMSYVGETTLLDGLRVFVLNEDISPDERNVRYFSPDLFGCQEVQREKYIKGVQVWRGTLVEYRRSVDMKMFERPNNYAHISPSALDTAITVRGFDCDEAGKNCPGFAGTLQIIQNGAAERDKFWKEKKYPD